MIVAAYIKLAKREAVICLSVVISPVESNQITHYAVGDTLYLESQPCYHALANTHKTFGFSQEQTKSNMDILQSLVGIYSFWLGQVLLIYLAIAVDK